MNTLSREKSEQVLERGVNYLKTASSCALQKHCEEYPKLERSNSTRVKKVSSYPVMVPDLSVDMVEEDVMRRNASALLTSHDPNCFKRRNLPESTGDWFESKHRVRHFLNTMHPYRDPLDKYKKFTKSRIPLHRDDADDLLSKPVDFLMPRDPTQQRNVGYNAGHIRSVLQLDTYGPAHSADVETKRSAGLLPNSPNKDRNRDLRTEICSASNSRTIAKLKKAKSQPTLQTSDPPGAGGSSPLASRAAARSPASSAASADSSRDSSCPGGDRTGTTKRRPQTSSAAAAPPPVASLYRPGTAPNATSTLPKFEDRLMTDSTARRLEWHRSYVRSVEEKQQAKVHQKRREVIQNNRENEAREVGSNIKWFENRLNTIHKSKSDSKF